MRINWFSPLPPARSDIAYYTVRTLPYLQAQADVVVWTDQTTWQCLEPASTEIRSYRPAEMPWAELNRADITVYHLGNGALHGPMWEVYQRHPGIVVLHDPYMRDFFLWRYPRLQDFAPLLRAHYGDEGARVAHQYFAGRAALEELLAFPLVKETLHNAIGVLVHTEHALELARSECALPMALSSLPFPLEATSPPPPRRRRWREPVRLVVFGFLGRNRGLSQILHAVGSYRQRERLELQICGPIENESPIRELIRSLNLERRVCLRGFLEPHALDQVLAESDLAINLRSPTFGELSGTQLRIWSHALPSLVSSIGWFQTLSDEVAFVRPAHEEEDLHRHFDAFLSQPGRFREMGRRGWLRLRQEHCPERYVHALQELVPHAQKYRKHLTALRFARSLAPELQRWTGETAPYMFERYAGELLHLAGD